jgi:hypothetical protein
LALFGNEGVPMKKSVFVFGLLASILMTSSAQALVCTGDYYTGYGHAKKWKQGRTNARADWSRKVDDHLGWPGRNGARRTSRMSAAIGTASATIAGRRPIPAAKPAVERQTSQPHAVLTTH